jgi:hypothetical protein
MMGSMMRRAMIGDSATLNVDFTSMTNGGQLANAGFTFTNATTTARTYINSSGLVATATTNEPRFDHDPTTLAPRGLLIEGSATNLLPNSQTLSGTGWFTGGICTRTSNYATGPDGIANSATRLEMSFSGGVGRTYYDSGYTTLPQTMSVWLKSNTGSNQTVNLWNTSGTPVSCTVTPTWKRFQSVSTTGSSLPGYFYFENPSTTVAVDILAWGAQLEAGSGASSYIPTVASTVTRLRDEVVLSSLPGIAFNQSAGTIYSQLEIVEKLRGSFVPYGSFDTSGGGRCWWWLRHNHDTSVGQRILGTAFNSGGSTAITSSNYTHSSGVFKFATSLDPVAGRMVYAIAGGSAQVTNASGFTLATAAQMSLNKNSDVAATDLGSMWVRSIKYWPTALPDATLQSMTT